MSRSKTWTVEMVEQGLGALGTTSTTPPILADAALECLLILRKAIRSASDTRLKRTPFDAKAQRIKQLEAMIAQYEPVAVEQEKQGFKTTRTKVTEWEAELRTLQSV